MKTKLQITILLATLLCGLLLAFGTPGQAQQVLYVYDLSAHHLNHYEYCVPLTQPGLFCAGFGPPPPGKTFPDLLGDYDLTIFAATLQGIVNKNGPRLYLIHDHDRGGAPGIDKRWLNIFRDGSKSYGWLAGYQVVKVESLGQLIDIFKEDLEGVVLWDTNVPATLNVATTIAGVENLAVLRAGSVLEGEITSRLPVQRSLVDKFRSKNEAYLWAIEQYLDSGQANPTLLAYFEDGWPAVLYSQNRMTRRGVYAFERDYVVQNRGFVFDLSPWSEPPVDDPGQAPDTDLFTLRDILSSARIQAGSELICIWGYIPWYQKYSNAPDAGGTHTDAAGEWESTWLFSSYGAYLAGGGGDIVGLALANLSVHSFAPQPARYVQPPPPTREQLMERGYLTPEGTVANKTYLLYYAGDYDLAHSVYVIPDSAFPYPWRDEKRGQVPIAWGFNPGLVEVMPDIMTYFLQTRSDQDFFVGPNSGAGYVNPGALPQALDSIWVQHSLRYYRPLHYSIQGWIWNGKGGPLSDDKKALFVPLAGDGMIFDHMRLEGHWPRMFQGVPVVARWQVGSGAITNAENAALDIHNSYKVYLSSHSANEPKFLIFRSTSYGPDFLWEVTQRLKADDVGGLVRDENGLVLHPDYQVVDPYTFFYLMRVYLGGHNEYRATYVSDNFPTLAQAGQTYDVQVVVRNDGWDTWQPPLYWLGVEARPGSIPPRSLVNYPLRVELPGEVPPGGTATLNFQWVAPTEQSAYTLQYDMMAEGVGTFEGQHDTPWQKTILIRP